MNEFKGTKGEWLTSTNTLYSLHEGFFAGEKMKVNRFYCGIYADRNYPEVIEELKHNIRLMSAAPNLLEACKELLGLLSFHGYNNATEIYKAKEAIDKALKT